jgi:macrodomain Ter protein organizer (MatP/YcbG family)
VKLDECLRVINRRLRSAEQEVARRKGQGLQYRPWQHRIQELQELRREIAELATPEEFRGGRQDRVAGQAGSIAS